MGLFDTLLAIGSTLDWITPARALAGAALGEDIIVCEPPSGRALSAELARHGIRVHAPQIVNGAAVVNVAGQDAARAREIIARKGW